MMAMFDLYHHCLKIYLVLTDYIVYLKSIKFLRLLNFTIFAKFCTREKPQNCKIKYLQNYVHAEFEILFFLILDQSMKLIPAYRN